MTSNRLKTDARKLAATEGLSYADALRRLLAQPTQDVDVYTFTARPGEVVVDAWGYVVSDTVFGGQAAWISGTSTNRSDDHWDFDAYVDYPARVGSWCWFEGLRDFHLATEQVATVRREKRPVPRPGTHELHLHAPANLAADERHRYVYVARIGHLVHLIDSSVDEKNALRSLARLVFGSGHTTYADSDSASADDAEIAWAQTDFYNPDADFDVTLVVND